MTDAASQLLVHPLLKPPIARATGPEQLTRDAEAR